MTPTPPISGESRFCFAGRASGSSLRREAPVRSRDWGAVLPVRIER
ncbi:hypothetical protein [Corynebacterium evansiae]